MILIQANVRQDGYCGFCRTYRNKGAQTMAAKAEELPAPLSQEPSGENSFSRRSG